MLKDLILLGVGAFFGLGATLMSLAAPLYFPNASRRIWHWLFWGGIVLMILMAANALVLLRWGSAIRASLWLIAILNVAVIVFSTTVIWLYDYLDSKKEKVSDVSLKLSKIRFDENRSAEMYVHFIVSNLGEPTILQNWILSAKSLNGDAFRISPRKIYTNVTFPPNGPPIEEDLSIDPLEKGGSRADAYATCSHSGPVAKFSEPGTVFLLSAEDVWGRKLISKHTIS
jgi:hypothetical protein